MHNKKTSNTRNIISLMVERIIRHYGDWMRTKKAYRDAKRELQRTFKNKEADYREKIMYEVENLYGICKNRKTWRELAGLTKDKRGVKQSVKILGVVLKFFVSQPRVILKDENAVGKELEARGLDDFYEKRYKVLVSEIKRNPEAVAGIRGIIVRKKRKKFGVAIEEELFSRDIKTVS